LFLNLKKKENIVGRGWVQIFVSPHYMKEKRKQILDINKGLENERIK
jgi:hypothetical protein